MRGGETGEGRGEKICERMDNLYTSEVNWLQWIRNIENDTSFSRDVGGCQKCLFGLTSMISYLRHGGGNGTMPASHNHGKNFNQHSVKGLLPSHFTFVNNFTRDGWDIVAIKLSRDRLPTLVTWISRFVKEN